jgi:hypothetical protein
MTIIEQNDTHVLQLEWMGKQHGGWWLELVDRETGHAHILCHQDKSYWRGFTIELAKKLQMQNPPVKMYKPGYAPVD